MENNQVFCLDCKKIFSDISSYNEEHDKPLYQVLKAKHGYIETKKSLIYFASLIEANTHLSNAIKMLQKDIKDLSERNKLLEDFNQDIYFECNIAVRIGKKTTINNIGKCLLNFFPKNILFRIECKGDIENKDKNNFNIEIVFPFRKTEIKHCNIEKLVGCAGANEITDSEGSTFLIYNNYTSYVTQKDSLISIKLLKNYGFPGKYEEKNINVIINGMLTFHSLIAKYDIPLILYNILEKKFLCYENDGWIFVDYFIENEKMKEGCIISLLIDNNDGQNVKVYIKGKQKYLGYQPNYSTYEKNEAELNIIFYNKIYGHIGIYKNDYYLSMENNGLIAFNKKESHYLICNI